MGVNLSILRSLLVYLGLLVVWEVLLGLLGADEVLQSLLIVWDVDQLFPRRDLIIKTYKHRD